jgi:hypothetical protein
MVSKSNQLPCWRNPTLESAALKRHDNTLLTSCDLFESRSEAEDPMSGYMGLAQPGVRRRSMCTDGLLAHRQPSCPRARRVADASQAPAVICAGFPRFQARRCGWPTRHGACFGPGREQPRLALTSAFADVRWLFIGQRRLWLGLGRLRRCTAHFRWSVPLGNRSRPSAPRNAARARRRHESRCRFARRARPCVRGFG